MKDFINKLILFSIWPFLFLLSIDIYLRNLNSSYSEKYNGLIKLRKNIEVIFLGNSHANYAINPSSFINYDVYNLADVNQQIYFDKRLTIKSLNSDFPKLKYVFISVDYHSLFTSSQGSRNIWSYYGNGIKYKDQNYTKANLSWFIWGFSPKVVLSILVKDVVSRLKYNESLIAFDLEKGLNSKDRFFNGFLGFEGSDSISFNNLNYKNRAATYKEDIIKSERVEVINDLNDFILFLKNKNIEPILFSSPTFRDYNKYLDQKQVERNLKDILRICKKNNIEYWRYDDDIQFSKEDFYNEDHLNKKGASKFSSILNNRLMIFDNSKR
jgi:hypothetical protein